MQVAEAYKAKTYLLNHVDKILKESKELALRACAQATGCFYFPIYGRVKFDDFGYGYCVDRSNAGCQLFMANGYVYYVSEDCDIDKALQSNKDWERYAQYVGFFEQD